MSPLMQRSGCGPISAKKMMLSAGKSLRSCGALRPMPRVCSRSVVVLGGSNSVQNIMDDDVRHMVASSVSYKKQGTKASLNPVGDFFGKVRLAWNIFFPIQIKPTTSKEEVKKRLRMVLVADRCGMSPASLTEMKKTIVTALQEFVDIEAEDAIEVSISTDPELGTVYSVNIPVRRVKPETRFGNGFPEGEVADGITLEWDPENWNSDPSARFPMGC